MFWVSLVLHRSVLNSGIPYLCSSFSQSWQTQMSCCPTWVLQTCPTTVTMTCSLCLRATELIHHSNIAVQHTASRLVEGSFGKHNRYPIASWHCFLLRLECSDSWEGATKIFFVLLFLLWQCYCLSASLNSVEILLWISVRTSSRSSLESFVERLLISLVWCKWHCVGWGGSLFFIAAPVLNLN